MPKYVYIVLDTSAGGSTSVRNVYGDLNAAMKDVEEEAEVRGWTTEYDGMTAYDPADDGNILQIEEKILDEKGLTDPTGETTGEVEEPEANVEEDFSSLDDEDLLEEEELRKQNEGVL